MTGVQTCALPIYADPVGDFHTGIAPKGQPESSPASPAHCQRDIFGNCHLGGGARKGILKHPTDESGPPVLGPGCDFPSLNVDCPLVEFKSPGHGIQQGAFTGSVGADNRSEGALWNEQINSAEGPRLVGRAGEKRFVDLAQVKHVAGV